jgi:hypothetical protein
VGRIYRRGLVSQIGKFPLPRLLSEPAIGDGSPIEATTSNLTDEQCRKLAERIVSVYTDLLGGLA